MAKDSSNVIPFPKSIDREARIQMKEQRLSELELENNFIHSDVEHLTKALDTNVKEIGEILKELAVLHKFEPPEVEFEPEFDSDFDFDFEFDFNPEEDK